jgi:predicted permease
MYTFWQDIRFGLRVLRKNLGFTIIAVTTLALGIGANTAIFSLMNQILLRRLPVRNPGELVILHNPGPAPGRTSSDGDTTESFSYPMYKGLRDGAASVISLIGLSSSDASLASQGQTERGKLTLVTGNFFDVLGVTPAIGRVFSPDDDKNPGGDQLAVLGYNYWTRHFGADPNILNKSILVNNVPMTIVGVSRNGFTGVQVGQTPDVYVPMSMAKQMTFDDGALVEWNDHWMKVLGRRAPGVDNVRARTGLNAAYHPLLEENLAKITKFNEEKRQAFLAKQIVLEPGARGRNIVQRDSGPEILILFAMVALVLLIACTNVANLLLARGASRQREFAIRSAMGATRARMVRQLVIESMLCALAGGVVGIGIGSWLIAELVPIVTANANIDGLKAELDPSVLLFAIAATLLSGILFGVLPAWRVTRNSVTDVIKDQGSTSSASVAHVRFRKFLVAGQVAFTLLLLAGAALFTKTLWNLRNLDLGFRTEHVITFTISPTLNGYDNPRMIRLVDDLRARLAALPGVRSVTSSELGAFSGDTAGYNITAEGGAVVPDDLDTVNFVATGPNYFSTFRVPLVSGREFTDADTANSPRVAVISETMAKRFFPGRNPIGMSFHMGGAKDKEPPITVVGLVRDMNQDHVKSGTPNPYIYLPYSQRDSLYAMSFYVNTERDPLQSGSAMQSVVRDTDPNLPVYNLKTMDRVIEEDLFSARIVAVLSAAFAGLAALLAALGIYGVLAFLVVQRTREIGIRMAVGAESGDIRMLVVKEVGSMLILGVLVGLPLAYGLAQLSESLLYGVSANNPLIYLVGLVLIAVVALVACYVPARRATRVDPLVALRYE